MDAFEIRFECLRLARAHAHSMEQAIKDAELAADYVLNSDRNLSASGGEAPRTVRMQ